MDTKQKELLLGLRDDFLLPIQNKQFTIHQDAQEDFEKLFEAARQEGFEITVISSFRNFDQQLAIWNNKAGGKRTLLDSEGEAMDFQTLSKEEILFSILRWSALPGFSRHHWGTELDVYDKKAIPPEGYEVQLIPQEFSQGGIFHDLHLWLEEAMTNQQSFGFFRPYAKDQGGVSPESWHLSYKPLSGQFLSQMTFEFFKESLELDVYQDLLLLDLVKENAEKIYHDYIINIGD